MKKPLKYRVLRKKHRMFEGVVDGKVVRYPTKCHNEGEEKPVPAIEAVGRAFKLTPENGVSDEEFYA